MKIPESARRDALLLLLSLLCVELVFAAVYVADILLEHPIKRINALFDLDKESTIPSWFSSVQLFAIAVVLWLKGRETAPLARPARAFWCFASAGFLFLSIDEAVAIHEQITKVLKRLAWVPRFKGDHGIWIPIYGIAILIILLSVKSQLQAIWKQGPRELLLMAFGMAIFLSGAVVLEIISYQYLRETVPKLWYYTEVAFEEFFEMVGASLILYGALRFYSYRAE